MTRCIYRPDGDTRQPAKGLPQGHAPACDESRNRIREYLDASLMPLPGAPQRHFERVQHDMETMTQSERVFIELEMQGRNRASHSFDYDPIK